METMSFVVLYVVTCIIESCKMAESRVFDMIQVMEHRRLQIQRPLQQVLGLDMITVREALAIRFFIQNG